MLVLRRKEGQWVELTHAKSGDAIRIHVCNIRSRPPGRLDLAFEDDARNFTIVREEQLAIPATAPATPPARSTPSPSS
jgi:hypothetical protein